jgi:hypothetical protein
MLTVGEFNAAADRHHRRLGRVLILIVSFFLGVVLTFTFLIDLTVLLPVHVQPWHALLGLWVACIAGIFAAVWAIDRSARRDPRLVCPHCDRGLFRARCRVAGTRKCPRCAQEILIDPDDPRSAPLTPEEAETRAVRFRWILFRFVPLMFVVSVVLYFPVATWLDALVEGGWISPTASESIFNGIRLSLVLWAVIQLYRLSCTLISCPRCRYVDTPRVAVKHGRCQACGQTLVAVPPPW